MLVIARVDVALKTYYYNEGIADTVLCIVSQQFAAIEPCLFISI